MSYWNKGRIETNGFKPFLKPRNTFISDKINISEHIKLILENENILKETKAELILEIIERLQTIEYKYIGMFTKAKLIDVELDKVVIKMIDLGLITSEVFNYVKNGDDENKYVYYKRYLKMKGIVNE